MRQVVIDTNVFVAAGFNPRSAAARILAAVREGRFQLIWNEPTPSGDRVDPAPNSAPRLGESC